MKTIFIWDQSGQESIKFFVVDGNYSHLNQVYLNAADNKQSEQIELDDLVYNGETGTYNVTMLDEFPVEEVLMADSGSWILPPAIRVVTVGLIP